MLKFLLRIVILVGLCFATGAFAQTQAVLPGGMQQFSDGNGVPYAGGHLYMYVPYTTTPKMTYQDPYGATPNQNPISLDSNGRAIIWGNGVYRQVLQDLNGVVVWDQLTYASPASAGGGDTGTLWYGTASGTTNAITLVGPTGFNATDGQSVGFIASATNTGSVTINASGYGIVLVEKNTITGPVPFIGGEIATGNLVNATYSAAVNAFLVAAYAPAQQVPSGQVAMFAGGSCPLGWGQNNGQAVSRSVEANLFGVIGTTYGTGDGTTTFNLPNDQGYFWRSVNTGGTGIDPSRTLGSTQTNAVATTAGTITSGTGTFSGATANTVVIGSTELGSGGTAGVSTGTVGVSGSISVKGGVVSVGTGTDTRPANIAFLSCIKY